MAQKDTPISSMTGFASATGTFEDYTWSCELRSVNAKGLDLRLRLPDWVEGLEADVRAALSAKLSRGSVAGQVRVVREDQAAHVAINPAQLDVAFAAIEAIETAAMERGVSLAPSRATDIAGMRGVLDVAAKDSETSGLKKALLSALAGVIKDLVAMRQSEGAALQSVLSSQLNALEAHVNKAGVLALRRSEATAKTLKTNLAKVIDNVETVDPDRVAQELAMIAVKSDVTEELDRLRTHVASARALLEGQGAVGRKLDFLMQEFNREANTLCAKAQHAELTTVGLALKALIDQMREQVQNVE